jgi:TetR/AcrR family acrAB operon transcriptional repressor
LPRQTKDRAEHTREAILDAAEVVFFRRGVSRATLEEIAAEAGVTRGAVYFHYRDKLDLFLAIGDRVQLPQEEIIAHLARSPPNDDLAALEDSVIAMFTEQDGMESQRIRLTVLLLRCDYVDEMAPALDRQAAIHRRFAEELQRYFRGAIPDAEERADWDPDLAALIFQTLVHGAILRWLRSPHEFSLRVEGARAIKGFLSGIRHNPRGDG